VPERIAGYRVLRKLGEGGMGVVYEVRQDHPVRRKLALKLVKWGMDTTEVLARFESERQALAMMDHPNVARVFEAGATEGGRPYFTMEYVEGDPITSYCDRNRLSTRERLELFTQVCDGVQHAHHNGIIHRDIKSSNVLVRTRDDRPVPTIIDFGVAKATQQRLTERTLFTELGMLIGTPEYMSPEQAELTGLDVDTRTDVYSLGVVLYELLVGALPFDPGTLREAGFDEIRRRIREEEPSRPSTRVSTLGAALTDAAKRRRTDPGSLRRELSGDLDWITMKALEKDRKRRYGSAAELAADIDRHLRQEPVLAGPPGIGYRLGKFVRRHRLSVSAAAALVVALLAGVFGTAMGLVEARREARNAKRVTRVLMSVFHDLDPANWLPTAASSRELLDRSVQRMEQDLADQPEVLAELMQTMGAVYKGLGLPEKARPLLERSAELHRRHLGTNSEDYALTISYLGDVLIQTGDYEEAQRLHAEALAIRERLLSPDHERIGWTLRSAGVARMMSGDYDAARSLLARALEIGLKNHGPEHPDVANTLRWQASVEWRSGNPESARPLLERSVEINEQTLGPEHLATAASMNDLAQLLNKLGEPALALPLAERAAGVFAKTRGPEDVRVAVSWATVGSIQSRLGELEAARSSLERSLAMLTRYHDPHDPERIGPLYALARVLARQGQRQAALERLREARRCGLDDPVLLDDPDLDALRGDPEFESIVEAVAQNR